MFSLIYIIVVFILFLFYIYIYRSIKKPSLTSPSKTLYMQAPKNLEMATRPNLDKTLEELVNEDEEVIITDPSLPIEMHIALIYSLDEKLVDDVVNA